jgi:hypothetical protein
MTTPNLRLRPLIAIALLGMLGGVVGCFNPFAPRTAPIRGFAQTAPVPNSASNLLRLFEWCYNNKAISEYRELFTDDYVFYFNPLDSAGEAYKQAPWRREDELVSTTHLFIGGSADQPPADRIDLKLDRSFTIVPDPNYVHSDAKGRWHKSILTQIDFSIQTTSDAQQVSGQVRFYVIRGDSALIPEEMRSRGFGPDSNRWYIRQLDDETNPTEIGGTMAAVRQMATRSARSPSPLAPLNAAPADFPGAASLGYVKVRWLGDGFPIARRASGP